MIPCNELEQTKAYLLQQFKICKKLKAEDMVLFLNYVYSVGLCLETGGGGLVNLDYTPAEDQGTVTNTAGTDAIIPLATEEYAGLFSPQEKIILANIVQDGLIYPGVVTWSGIGFIYNVSQALIKLGGEVYLLPTDTVTLTASDPTNPRIDVVYADANGFGVLTGTPAAEPVMPQVDPSSQIFLTSIIVAAATTEPEPSDVPTENVYQENLEYTISKTGTGTINADSTTTPYAGLKAIENTNIQNGYTILANRGSDFNYTDFDTISFRIHLKASLNNNHNIFLSLYNENGDKVVQGIQVQLNKSLVGLYQFVAVNINDFVGESPIARTIGIEFIRTGGASTHAGFFIDDWKLQGGISQPTPVTEHNALQGLNVGDFQHLTQAEKALIISALQSGDNVSELFNDVEYITLADLPTPPTIPTNTSDLTNDGEDGVNPFVDTTDFPNANVITAATYTLDGDGLNQTNVCQNAIVITIPNDVTITKKIDVKKTLFNFKNTGTINYPTTEGLSTLAVTEGALVYVERRNISNEWIVKRVDNAPTIFTTNEVALHNILGAYKSAVSTAAIYTLLADPAPVTGGWAKYKINVSQATLDAATLTEPEITGGTKIAGSDFVVDTDMYVIVEKTISGAVEYWFAQIAE